MGYHLLTEKPRSRSGAFRIGDDVLVATCGDHLYSVASITNASGVVVERYTYGAYGKMYVRDASGALKSGQVPMQPYGFTGRRYDSESGLWYFRARYFDDQLGRFLGRWTDAVIDQSYYRYQWNNPANMVDPWGDPDPPLTPQNAEEIEVWNQATLVWHDARQAEPPSQYPRDASEFEKRAIDLWQAYHDAGSEEAAGQIALELYRADEEYYVDIECEEWDERPLYVRVFGGRLDDCVKFYYRKFNKGLNQDEERNLLKDIDQAKGIAETIVKGGLRGTTKMVAKAAAEAGLTWGVLKIRAHNKCLEWACKCWRAY